MDRRAFLRATLASAGAATTLPSVAMAAPLPHRQTAGPYGSIDGRQPDENGLLLPEGFTSRRVAVAGEPVGTTDYAWHVFPDGAATFEDGDGGWYYVCNSEVFAPDGAGGASAIHFDADGEIVDAYRALDGTTANCAGGPTPWGTWLSCEERIDGLGQVWETDPTGETPGQARPALGRWAHEAVAVDPDGEALYLTEDNPAGHLYRFTPEAYPDLDAGQLDAAVVAEDGSVAWIPVPDPSATSAPVRDQVAEATVFPGNEGIWFHEGVIVFTSKVDNRVHEIDLGAQQYRLLYDGTTTPEPLRGVDNVTFDAGSGDVFVAEDGGNMEVVLLTPEGDVVPFARVVEAGHDGSEVTGPCFSPDGTRLYFSSQRGTTPKTITEIAGDRGVVSDLRSGGVTWEVTGPFRGAGSGGTTTTTSPSTTIAGAGGDGSGGDGDGDGDDGDGGSAAPIVGVVAAAAVVGAGAAWWLRRRRSTPDGPAADPDAGPDEDAPA
jgi:secreted PhoX family phosphatase